MTRALALSGETPPEWLLGDFPAGIGLIRGEYLMRDAEAYVLEPDVRQRITDYLIEMGRRAEGRPVWYRTSDLDASEAAVLRGVEEAFLEAVPHLGTRGIRRGLRFPDTLRCELAAFREAQLKAPNLRMLFPFISTVEQAAAAAGYAREAGIEGELGLMAETPAAVLSLPEILAAGYAHVLVGCNDLWALTMAEVRRPGNFPTATPALIRLVEMARAHTTAGGATLAIAGYLDPELQRMATDVGADAVVVHYSQLPKLFGERYSDLPDLGMLADIKRRSRAAVAKLQS